MVPMDDRSLIDALLAGDPDAARCLIERFQTVVFSLCYRMMGNRHDAEDVMQEAFLRAFQAIGGFDRARPVRPWLLGIAANRCRTALARRNRRPAATEAVWECIDPRPGIADPDDLATELSLAIGHLRPEYRTVFTLYHEQNLAYDEIADVVNRPVGTVKTWLHRARAELADHLSRRGVRC
jgi:RNA polymerase sigma factor (sigma-70 family)